MSNNDISHIGELIFNNIDVIKEDCVLSDYLNIKNISKIVTFAGWEFYRLNCFI